MENETRKKIAKVYHQNLGNHKSECVMCFYSRQTKTAVEVENRFNATIKDSALFSTSERINGFTHLKTPVVINEELKIIQFYNWGLIPYWAKDKEIRKNTLNARIETINEKPSFRNAVKNRCLVIADGFYEWKWLDEKGKQKQQYLITLPDNALFAFAGIYSSWTDKSSGEIINTYSIVTTEAKDLMSEIHNSKKRMPVILTPENEKEWLSGLPIVNFSLPQVNLMATEV